MKSTKINRKEVQPVEALDPQIQDQQIEISNKDGRTQIVFRKALLKGKVTPTDVLNSILIAARMQAEKYIEKLSRGAPLDVSEVKALKELADITKLSVPEKVESLSQNGAIDIDSVKSNIYSALAEKLKDSK